MSGNLTADIAHCASLQSLIGVRRDLADDVLAGLGFSRRKQ
jgi:hypothetical protein